MGLCSLFAGEVFSKKWRYIRRIYGGFTEGIHALGVVATFKCVNWSLHKLQLFRYLSTFTLLTQGHCRK
jgi:hypothetical protein